MDILTRIKQLVLRRQIIITMKAELEVISDSLTEDEVIEAIVNASRIQKRLRSRSFRAASGSEMLYVIKGRTYSDVVIYTKVSSSGTANLRLSMC